MTDFPMLFQTCADRIETDMNIGAAYKKTSREGRDKISIKLGDPSFPVSVYATLSETAGK